jgi:hypothetical protein
MFFIKRLCDLEDLPRIVVWCETRVMWRAFGCIRPVWMAVHDLERRAIRPICGSPAGYPGARRLLGCRSGPSPRECRREMTSQLQLPQAEPDETTY